MKISKIMDVLFQIKREYGDLDIKMIMASMPKSSLKESSPVFIYKDEEDGNKLWVAVK